MKRFSGVRMHSPGLSSMPSSRLSVPLRQPAAAPIWQLSALIASGALVVFLLVRAVQMSLLMSAMPPAPAKVAAPVAPPLAITQPAVVVPSDETPASAWPPPSSPSVEDWSGRQVPRYYYRAYPTPVYYHYYVPSGANGTDEYRNRGYSSYGRGYAYPTPFYSYGDDGP